MSSAGGFRVLRIFVKQSFFGEMFDQIAIRIIKPRRPAFIRHLGSVPIEGILRAVQDATVVGQFRSDQIPVPVNVVRLELRGI